MDSSPTFFDAQVWICQWKCPRLTWSSAQVSVGGRFNHLYPFVIFTIETWENWSNSTNLHIFQMGWFNHQLVLVASLRIYFLLWQVFIHCTIRQSRTQEIGITGRGRVRVGRVWKMRLRIDWKVMRLNYTGYFMVVYRMYVYVYIYVYLNIHDIILS